MPYVELLDEIIELLREDAEAFGCTAELDHARAIVARGTSAQSQRAVFARARRDGADDREALVAVVDWLVEETLHGLEAPA